MYPLAQDFNAKNFPEAIKYKDTHRCLHCRAASDFACYLNPNSEITTWLCWDCLIQLKQRVCDFIDDKYTPAKAGGE